NIDPVDVLRSPNSDKLCTGGIGRARIVRAGVAGHVGPDTAGNGGADDILARRETIEPKTTEVVRQPSRSGGHEPPPAAFISQLQRLNTCTGNRPVLIVQHPSRQRAPARQPEDDLVGGLARGDLDALFRLSGVVPWL